jgi:uncharacterized protein involved in response to NO
MLLTLVASFAVSVWMALAGEGPAVPRDVNHRLLGFTVWAFLVPFVWGLTARWAPALLGVEPPAARRLLPAYLASVPGVAALALGWDVAGAAILLVAAAAVASALGIFSPARRPAATEGVHPCLPAFVRAAYAWLLVGAALGLWGAVEGGAAGFVGASRHALTVGFLSTMVFAVGPRILPLFTGTAAVFSPLLVVVSLGTLGVGCTVRVVAQVLAYEGYAAGAWGWLPVSAVVELAAVSLFAANLGLTLVRGGVTKVTDGAARPA